MRGFNIYNIQYFSAFITTYFMTCMYPKMCGIAETFTVQKIRLHSISLHPLNPHIKYENLNLKIETLLLCSVQIRPRKEQNLLCS